MTDLSYEVQNAHDACEALCGEWHTYDMALDDARYEAYDKLLEAGFVRVGINRQDCVLEFEGKEAMHQKSSRTIKQVLRDWNASHPWQQYPFTCVFNVWKN